MSDKETKERIESEAIALATEILGQPPFMMDDTIVTGYIAGAETERPKAWNDAIDACIKRLENEIQLWLIVHPDPQPGSPASYGIDSLNQAIRHIREFDKIKQP